MKSKTLKKKVDGVSVAVSIVMVVFGLIIIYPFYNAILISFMKHSEYMRSPLSLYVSEPTLVAYKELFSDGKIFIGYKSTLTILVFKLPCALLIQAAMAYALSRKQFLFKNIINHLTVFTMYFSGGVIPQYLLIKQYGLMGSYASIILLGLFSVFNMILIKNYFYSLPDELEESAKLDGANDVTIFARIYLPLAKPILATVALYIAVETWNEWYTPMLYLTDSKKWPLQLVLREMIQDASAKLSIESASMDEMDKDTFALNVQMASVVVTMLPIMLVYPFLQKYFMSGLTVGAVKG